MKITQHIEFEDFIPEGFTIETTITKNSNDVSEWIAKLENSDDLKINKLNIGLDTEWTPSNGAENPIAILQLCVGFKCLIFQVNLSPEIPGSLITFFNNPEYTFTGVEIKNDIKKLKYKRAFLERNMQDFGSKMLDVRELAIQMKCFNVTKDFGLMKLANTVLKDEIKSELKKDKDATISNWHVEDLSPDQVKYASLDAYLSFRIGQVLLEKSKNDSRV